MRMHAALLVALASCSDHDAPTDPCAAYVRPPRVAIGCGDPSDPTTLVPCDTGSGLAGTWAIDGDGLPAYDLAIDERCDGVAHAYSPSPNPPRDPLHVVGDGYGMVAMAHASGGLDVYSQDRGHKWPVKIEDGQLGAAIGYVIAGGRVHSTRFEDMPPSEASARQTRRFGVGYVETVTQIGQLAVTRRVFAASGQRALVTEVTVENAGGSDDSVGLVELDDTNLYELPAELVTSDLLAPSITTDIARRRHAIDDGFAHHASYDAAARVAAITTDAATAPPVGPDDPSDVDYYPETAWLAPLDDDAPDAVWLADSELWQTSDREPPARAAAPGDASSRVIDLPGTGQPGLLAARVRVIVPAHGAITTRFAFGLVPHGGDPIAAAAAVRASHPDGRAAAQAWRSRLVWAAVAGQPHAGALQRELAWSSYAAQALATYDAYHHTRLLGQGGSYKYIHGIDGAIGDYAIYADAIGLIDPQLAADTLAFALATQRAPSLGDGGRFPYATTGVGNFTDVVRYDLRSDAYFLLPSMIARYVALARDPGFLSKDVAYWPRSAGASGSVLDHLRRTQDFADQQLGFGAHGLVAMGTNDYADGVLQTASEPATPHGASSTFNAWLLVGGYGLAADIVASQDAALAQRYRDERADQLAKLEQFAWNGTWYERGFVDSGNPLGHASLYLEPQVLPIVAGAVDDTRRAALLDLVTRTMDTEIGPMTVVPLGAGGASGSVDMPQVGGVWPVSGAWLTEAFALADPVRGWDSLVRNTLFAHAEAFPALWYGVWSGPDSYYGPDAERPGEADANLATALTDYPVFNVHAHASVLRALVAVAGISGTAAGVKIHPHLPTETFELVWPRLALKSSPSAISGSITTVGSAPFELRVHLPSQLRAATTLHANVPVTRDGDDAVITVTSSQHWEITQ